MSRPAPLLLALLLALPAWTPPAAGQVIRRCVDAQGVSIFTDRQCSEMNAAPMQAPPAPDGNFGSGFSGGFMASSCARRPEDLLERVRSALESRDVNRLASQYHWTGTGSGSGKRLMDALEAIAKRPLVSVDLIYPEPDPLPDPPAPLAYGELPPDFMLTAAEPVAAPMPRHIRVLQLRSEQAEQATGTVFQLRRNAGCWWIQL